VATDWEMPRRGEICCVCQKAFEPGDELRAYLFETPEGYQRRDYCLNCPAPAEPGNVGSWKTRRPLPAAKKSPVFDRDAIFQLFTTLEDAEAPERVQLRFVLALLLWRKKALKFAGAETREDREAWLFTTPKADARYAVVRPALGESQLERLGEQLEALLAGEITDISTLIPETDLEQAAQPEAGVKQMAQPETDTIQAIQTETGVIQAAQTETGVIQAAQTETDREPASRSDAEGTSHDD
jgi:hypothetical protein